MQFQASEFHLAFPHKKSVKKLKLLQTQEYEVKCDIIQDI
jgi:hypothetical protein